jgi:hypothetical protein
MKNIYFFSFIFLLNSSLLFSQVAINTDGSPPASSAILDVKSTHQGVLIPRVTFEQLNGIENPAEGLMLYCTNCNVDGTGVLSIYQGGKWKIINLDCYAPNTPSSGTNIPAVNQIIWNWNTVPIALGYKWNTTNDYSTATNLGTATSKTETGLACGTTYSRYVWAYNACGKSSELTLTQSVPQSPFSPAPIGGTHIPSVHQIVWKWNHVPGAAGYKWNTTNDFCTATDVGSDTSKTETGLSCNTSYTRYVWACNNCQVSVSTTLTQATPPDPPAVPIPATNVALPTQIVWNWNPVCDAAGYKWNTVNDYYSATDMGTDTSKTETGLSCNSDYTRYAWAYNGCGNSTSVPLTQSTLYCWTCGASYTVNHIAGNVAPVDKTVTYGTVTNIPGETLKCWITSNLGADQQAASRSDATEASAGWYWQYNRMQGYKHDGTTRTPNTTWITEINEYSVWAPANDPCTLELGTGWRIPTATEWNNVDGAGGWNNWNGPWNSALKMHAAGYINWADGSLSLRGIDGSYWSCAQSNPNTAQTLFFYSSSCSMNIHPKSMGYSVRCVQD